MKHDKQKKAYRFLQSRIGKTFTADDLATAARWSNASASTYLSKHLKGLVERVEGTDLFKVRREFRRFTFEQYTRLADQTRRVFQTYDREEYGGIVTFEFLLPLTQESKLRRALDDIFYLDTVTDVLQELGTERFESWIPRRANQSEEAYAKSVANHANRLFGGYSVSHVSGRFRAAELMTRKDAGKLFEKDRPYLMDETTASVRFIVPLSKTKVTVGEETAEQLVLPVVGVTDDQRAGIESEVEFIRTLFFCLFVEALIRNVTGEDEIWLIEHSPAGRRLHVWRPES